jgi:hypothetical protein
MTIQDLEHRLERVEAQHSDYVSALSSHTATLATLVAQVADLQKGMTHVIAEVAVVRQEVSGIGHRLERLETFLRQRPNGGSGHDRESS